VISTHVLDTERGAPARGVRVDLYRDDVLVGSGETDGDGRIAELAGEGLHPGPYRIVFHPPSRFFRRVELKIEIEDADRHHHVPLLISSYGCASYRGS